MASTWLGLLLTTSITDTVIGYISAASLGNRSHVITMVGLSLQSAVQVPSPFSLEGKKRKEETIRCFEAQRIARRIAKSATLIKGLKFKHLNINSGHRVYCTN